MSEMSHRRLLAELIYRGTQDRGLEGQTALMRAPVVIAQVLEGTTGEPCRAYLAVGAADVAALEAFMLERQGEGRSDE